MEAKLMYDERPMRHLCTCQWSQETELNRKLKRLRSKIDVVRPMRAEYWEQHQNDDVHQGWYDPITRWSLVIKTSWVEPHPCLNSAAKVLKITSMVGSAFHLQDHTLPWRHTHTETRTDSQGDDNTSSAITEHSQVRVSTCWWVSRLVWSHHKMVFSFEFGIKWHRAEFSNHGPIAV